MPPLRRPEAPRRDLDPRRQPWAAWLAAPGLIALIAEPAIWLARSWRDPSYQSDGALVAVAIAALVLRSVWSGPVAPDPRARLLAWRLLLGTAAIRLAGRLLAVKTIGALALCLDVAAVALLLGVARRPWALSPFWLAAFSVLALPVEHVLQRLLGHPLQLLAAHGASVLLLPAFPDLVRHGTLLSHPGVELSVDLPCSGARGLVLLSGLLLALLCRRSARVTSLALGTVAVGAGALLANGLRIIGLFIGTWAGWPIVEEPAHSALGTLCLAAGALPLLSLATRLPQRTPIRAPLLDTRAPGISPLGHGPPRFAARRAPWLAPLAVAVLGVLVANVPERPVDVSPIGPGRPLPERLGGFVGVHAPLSEQERVYFARYGGGVRKTVYRDDSGIPHTALVVRTAAPLRHLHGPDRCLLGAGHRVTRLGVRAGEIPTVVYRSVSPDGRAWRVETSFVSDGGESAPGVSAVVWRWLERPEVAWNLVERISPWDACETSPDSCRRLDEALFHALDLRAPASPAPAEPLRLAARGSDPLRPGLPAHALAHGHPDEPSTTSPDRKELEHEHDHE